MSAATLFVSQVSSRQGCSKVQSMSVVKAAVQSLNWLYACRRLLITRRCGYTVMLSEWNWLNTDSRSVASSCKCIESIIWSSSLALDINLSLPETNQVFVRKISKLTYSKSYFVSFTLWSQHTKNDTARTHAVFEIIETHKSFWSSGWLWKEFHVARKNSNLDAVKLW